MTATASSTPSKVFFEFPLNERFRTFLRIENLFQRWQFYLASNHQQDHHTAVLTLLDLYDFTFRNDIKGDLLSELNRYKASLNQYYGSPEIAEDILTETILRIVDAQKQIEQSPKFGSNLVENEWLVNVKSRLVVASGVCSFDMGFYYQWLQEHPGQRREDLQRWSMPFATLFETVNLLLSISRNMAFNKDCTTMNRSYQQPLYGRRFDILQVEMAGLNHGLPDMSANKHVIWLRFTPPALQPRPAGTHRVSSSDEICFHLGLCGAPVPSAERQKPKPAFAVV